MMFDLFTVLDACAKVPADFSVKADVNGVQTEVISSDNFYKYCEYHYWDRNVYSRCEVLEGVVLDFQNAWSTFLAFEQTNIDKMVSVYLSEYNPLNNTDRTENTTITSSGTDTTTNTATYGKTTQNSGNDVNIDTSSATGYNNASEFTPTAKDESNTTHGKKITDGGSDVNVNGVTYGKKDVTEFHTSGTIGVITNQDMIEKELKLRENVLATKIITKFIRQTTMYC